MSESGGLHMWRQASHDRQLHRGWIRSPNRVHLPVGSIEIVSLRVPVPRGAASHWLTRNGFRELCMGTVLLREWSMNKLIWNE